ncbi:MAG: thioredoxin, partial [Proteobacteria bacterium]|nr:thioredoxin [Pseudomonadota bacterium]
TTRDPREVVGRIPPSLASCTVEKVAINAVMAGCRPEYLPVVLAALEASLEPSFSLHGVLATTYFAGPMVLVNGPVAKRIGMNSGVNALGQGNRANATIGRALQLVIRNVGGGKPGGVDRATLGNPGKVGFCFAEDESEASWPPFCVERGFPAGTSTVTVFAAEGPVGNYDDLSRTPESLTRSLALTLRIIGNPKRNRADAFLVLSPEHRKVYQDAGWSKDRVYREFSEVLRIPAQEMTRGSGGIAEGLPPGEAAFIDKFRPGGFFIVRAGGGAGRMSAVIGGWIASGERGSMPVTREVKG